MPIALDPNEILHAHLARSLGLDRYAEIMRGDPASPTFQRLFNGYYRVRRNDQWRKHYYDLFQKARAEQYDFAQIATELYHATGNVEASFSSKMLATINPDRPIWDQYVLLNLGLNLTGRTQDERIRNAILLYDEIIGWYKAFLATEAGKECIRSFDRWLPNYAWVSSVKKIDCLLWSNR